MRKLILLSVALMLAGCSSNQGLNNVQRELGTQEVVSIPGRNYEYIARDKTNAVFYCTSTGLSDMAICAMVLPGERD